MNFSDNTIWKRHSAILFFLAAMLVGLSLIAIVPSAKATTDVDQDGVPDDVELANARVVHVNITSSDILIDSRGAQDRLLFDFNNATAGLAIQVTYWANKDVPSPSDGFGFNMNSLLEFTDNNSDGIYTPGVDKQISIYVPNGWIFKSIKDDTITNGYTSIAVQTHDGLLGVVARIGSTFGLANGKLVTPTSIKFDLSINGFHFANSSTKLAASFSVTRNGTSTLETTTEVERLFGTTGETGIRFGNATGVRGSIAWADQVLVNGTTLLPVIYGPITQNAGLATTEHDIYITLPQGAKIEWDPRVGMDGILTTTVPSPPFPWLTVGYIAGGVVVGVVIGAVIMRAIPRKRGRESPSKGNIGTPNAMPDGTDQSNPIPGIGIVVKHNPKASAARGQHLPGRPKPAVTSQEQTMIRESPSKGNIGTPNAVPEGTDQSNPIPGIGIVVKHNPKASAARGQHIPGRPKPAMTSQKQTMIRESPSKGNVGMPNAIPEGTDQSNPIPGIGIVVKQSPTPIPSKAMQPGKPRESPSKAYMNQELHRPPTFMAEQTDVSITKLIDGEALSPMEAKVIKQLGQKLRYGNPLTDNEIDAIGKILSYNQGVPVDAREVLSRRNSHDMLTGGLDEVVNIIEKAMSGRKGASKTQV
ncbi:MAG TPA: hypothetical protein VKM55_07370 [Candidatus Lokiarchaeia archaeon]|nr:hypothetical protein [Candidatus Lokiarchaeia archaeon]